MMTNKQFTPHQRNAFNEVRGTNKPSTKSLVLGKPPSSDPSGAGFTIFAIISVLLLIGVFFMWLLSDLSSLGQGLSVEQAVVENKNNDFRLSDVDPLITSVSEIYQSFIGQDDPVRGNPESELVILEFGDFECPYCQEVYPVLSNILVEFDGQVKLIWKDFANPVHLNARSAAMAARCAQDQGKFWEYHDYLFENQESLSRDLYNQIALELDLNLAEFNGCLDGNEKIELIGRGLEEGQSLGVDATPYIFIGNRSYDWAMTEEELREAVERELK